MSDLSPDVAALLSTHKEADTQRQYTRYKERYLTFCTERGSQPLCEISFLNFFGDLIQHEYAASTLWSIYSALGHFYLLSTGKKLQEFPRIQALLKTYHAKAPAPKKASVFTEDQIETIIFGPMFSANEELVKKMVALFSDMKRITFSRCRKTWCGIPNFLDGICDC